MSTMVKLFVVVTIHEPVFCLSKALHQQHLGDSNLNPE